MKINLNIDKKFLISSGFLIVIYNLFFIRFLVSKIFIIGDSDFWATLYVLKTAENVIRSFSLIKDIALRFSDSPEKFAYFIITVFLILCLILSNQIIDSFKIINRNITFKYIIIVFLSTALNPVLATRSVINIRWTIASILYTIFIIKFYRYIQLFHSKNPLIRKIFYLKEYKYQFKNIKQKISLFSIIFFLILLLSIHTYAFYYFLSLITLVVIRLSIFFKQRFLAIGLIISSIIISAFLILPFFKNISGYLVYNNTIDGITQYIIIFSTFILHLSYIVNFKVRNWIDNHYPWAKMLLMSTGLGFIFPIPFMLTRIYVPYLILFPLIILTFVDKVLFKVKL